jgi:formate dehydrogenase accessory protein FdhD
MMSDGAVPFTYAIYDGKWDAIQAEVIEEGQIAIFVNGRELAVLMCSPFDPEQLALGFLANEGLIENLDDVEISHVCNGGGCVDIWLSHSIWDKPRRRVITSGCTGGQTFRDLAESQPPLESDLRDRTRTDRQLDQPNAIGRQPVFACPGCARIWVK